MLAGYNVFSRMPVANRDNPNNVAVGFVAPSFQTVMPPSIAAAIATAPAPPASRALTFVFNAIFLLLKNTVTLPLEIHIGYPRQCTKK